MHVGKRPGGLTALAVINFLFCVINVGGIFTKGLAVALAANKDFAERMLEQQKSDAQRDAIQLLIDNTDFFLFMIAFNAAMAITTLLAGIGYLKQKKFLGRGIGNIYVLLSFLSVAYLMLSTSRFEGMNPAENPAAFNLFTLISLLYPLITLVMINTSFKRDFVN